MKEKDTGIVLMYMHDLFVKLNDKKITAGLFIVTVLFFAVTNPAKLPPIVLMIGFGLILATLYGIVRLLLVMVGVKQRLKPQHYSLLVFSLTVLPVLLIALQSLGQLTLRDGATLLLLFIIGFFYVSRTTA